MLLNAEVETWLRASSNTNLCGPTDTEANSNLLSPLPSGQRGANTAGGERAAANMAFDLLIVISHAVRPQMTTDLVQTPQTSQIQANLPENNGFLELSRNSISLMHCLYCMYSSIP